MNWNVSFFNEKVSKTTLSFPKGILANFLHIVEMIEQFGPSLGMPYTKAFGKGLFEIRAKGQEGIGRSFFARSRGMKWLSSTLSSRKRIKPLRKTYILLKNE